MHNFEFTIAVKLQDAAGVPEQYMGDLRAAGCEDTLVAIGQPGIIGLAYMRQAPTLCAAIDTAVDQLRRVIPDAEVIQVSLLPRYKGATALQAISKAFVSVNLLQDRVHGTRLLDALTPLAPDDPDTMAVRMVRELEEGRPRLDPFERAHCYRLPALPKEDLEHLLAVVHDYEGYAYWLFTAHDTDTGMDLAILCVGDQEAVDVAQADLKTLLGRAA